jgi:hypothetical protein
LAAMSARLEEVATSMGALNYSTWFGTLSDDLGAASGRLDEIGAATGRLDRFAADVGERLETLEQFQRDNYTALTEGIDRIGSRLEGLRGPLAKELATPDPVAWATLADQLKQLHGTVAQIGGSGGAASAMEQQAGSDKETPVGGEGGAGTHASGAAGSKAGDGGRGEGGAAGDAARNREANEQPPEVRNTDGANGSSNGGTELGIGRTASFGDGALRVTLSAVAPDARTARVAVNGLNTTTLEVGSPMPVEDCELELTDVRQDGATLTARCGASSQGG